MFDPHDDRQLGLAIGIVMVAGLVMLFVEHWGYVPLLVKAITLLLVSGAVRIWLTLYPKAVAARDRARRPIVRLLPRIRIDRAGRGSLRSRVICNTSPAE